MSEPQPAPSPEPDTLAHPAGITPAFPTSEDPAPAAPAAAAPAGPQTPDFPAPSSTPAPAPAPAAQAPQGPQTVVATATVPALPAQVSGVPYAYVAEVPRRRSRKGVFALVAVAAVMALAAGAMTTLFLLERKEHDAAKATVAQQSTQLTQDADRIKDLEGQAAANKSQIEQLTQDLATANRKTGEVTKVKEALTGCFKAINDYVESQTEFNRNAMDAACDEAAKYY